MTLSSSASVCCFFFPPLSLSKCENEERHRVNSPPNKPSSLSLWEPNLLTLLRAQFYSPYLGWVLTVLHPALKSHPLLAVANLTLSLLLYSLFIPLLCFVFLPHFPPSCASASFKSCLFFLSLFWILTLSGGVDFCLYDDVSVPEQVKISSFDCIKQV